MKSERYISGEEAVKAIQSCSRVFIQGGAATPHFTSQGISRVVSTLTPGAGVVTTRAHAHYVVTEYGIADLYGKNMRQRAKALIAIAHPNQREALEKAAFERFKSYEFEHTIY